MQALVVAAHGSHLNPGAARPALDHADRIRATGAFDEVRAAFWKEQPGLREVLRTLHSDEVFVVPLFVAEGYFTEQVVPRELRLAGWTGWDSDGTSAGHATLEAADTGQTVHYCGPVGTHDAMTDVIVGRAESVTGDPDVGEGVGLALVGHGTERNPHSAAATRYHADRIRERGRFASVAALFLDEAPEVSDLADHLAVEDVVLVPLFVADGYHTREDIPRDVGLARDRGSGFDVPARVDGHRIWYAGAVGTEPLVAGVLVERAADAGADVGDVPVPASVPARGGGTAVDRVAHGPASRPGPGDAGRAFLAWLDGADRRTWGQLLIRHDAGPGDGSERRRVDDAERYELRHADDAAVPTDDLERLDGPLDARDRVRHDGTEAAGIPGEGTGATGATAKDTAATGPPADDTGATGATANDTGAPGAPADDPARFRPLAYAPTLPGGWVLADLDPTELLAAVEHVYPASIANWHRERQADLDVTHWRSAAGRHTGIYDVVEDLPVEGVEALAGALCEDCTARREWDLEDGAPLSAPRGEGAFPCREPCSLAIAAAKEFLTVEERLGGLPDGDCEQFWSLVDAAADRRVAGVREGAIDDPANPYRARYLLRRGDNSR